MSGKLKGRVPVSEPAASYSEGLGMYLNTATLKGMLWSSSVPPVKCKGSTSSRFLPHPF